MKRITIKFAVCLITLAVSSIAVAQDYGYQYEEDKGINQQHQYAEDRDFYQDAEYQTYGGTIEDREDYRNERESLNNQFKMIEAVEQIGLSYEDGNAIIDHVERGNRVTSDSLRGSGISNEGWNQIRDDARFE